MSNSLDPDQARCFVRPALGPNCLQRFSADREMTKIATSGERVNAKACKTKKHNLNKTKSYKAMKVVQILDLSIKLGERQNLNKTKFYKTMKVVQILFLLIKLEERQNHNMTKFYKAMKVVQLLVLSVKLEERQNLNKTGFYRPMILKPEVKQDKQLQTK